VGVVLFVAGVALHWRLTVFFSAHMTFFTSHGLMFAAQLVVCLGMVKLLFVQRCNLSVTTLVVGMARVARLRLESSVKTGFCLHIRPHVLVAVHA